MDCKDAGTTYLNQYRNISKDTVKSYPTITGEIYIDNSSEDEPVIVEDELTTKYGVAWPNLKITAARVQESFLGKYIVLEDSGKESEYDVIRYNPAQYEGQPVTLTSKLNPSKGSTYDFLGWATDTAGENMVFDAEGNMTTYGQNYTFSAESRTVITLYAIFEDHKFAVTFKNAVDSNSEISSTNDQIIEVKYATYGNTVTAPDTMVLSILDDSNLGLTDVYKFKGYTRLRANTLVKSQSALKRALVDLSTMPLSEDVTLYACYMLQDVHTEPTDEKYFTITANGDLDVASAYKFSAISQYNSVVSLKGKIVIPNTVNGITVKTITGFAAQQDITHIFVMPGNQITKIGANCFQWCSGLQYVEWPEGLIEIGDNAFNSCTALTTSDLSGLPLTTLGTNAFRNAFYSAHTDSNTFTESREVYFPGTLTSIGNGACSFNNNTNLALICIGSESDLFDLPNATYN